MKSIQSINQPMITVKLQFDTNRLTIITNYGWAEYAGEDAARVFKCLDEIVELVDDDFDNVENAEPPDETE
jgi:hypothetical protein